MKRSRVFLLSLFMLIIPSTSFAYFGAGLGVVDESEFGYGLLFGGHLPWNLGLQADVVGFVDTGVTDTYYFQGDIDLAYDFNFLWKRVSEQIELHPYVKGGFTYGAALFDGIGFDIQASHGPGFNIGAGVDWKVMDFLTVGFDITEAFIFLDGVNVTVSGTNVSLGQDRTAKVFNLLANVKFFAY